MGKYQENSCAVRDVSKNTETVTSFLALISDIIFVRDSLMSQKYFSISASVFSDSHPSVFCKHQRARTTAISWTTAVKHLLLHGEIM